MTEPEFQYEHITPGERAEKIRARLRGLEDDHANTALDVEAAGPGGNQPQETRLRELEQRILKLRERAKALERDGAAKS